jgi:hypothetical protein
MRFVRPLTASLRFIRVRFVLFSHLICEHALLVWRQDGYDTYERISTCMRLFVLPGLSDCKASSDSLMANLSSISCSVEIGSTQGDAHKVMCREMRHADTPFDLKCRPFLVRLSAFDVENIIPILLSFLSASRSLSATDRQQTPVAGVLDV